MNDASTSVDDCIKSVPGWRADSFREPPDNREIDTWEYYLPGQNLVATVTGIGSTYKVQAVPPLGQRGISLVAFVLYGTDAAGALHETEDVLRDLGHALPASDPPV